MGAPLSKWDVQLARPSSAGHVASLLFDRSTTSPLASAVTLLVAQSLVRLVPRRRAAAAATAYTFAAAAITTTTATAAAAAAAAAVAAVNAMPS